MRKRKGKGNDKKKRRWYCYHMIKREEKKGKREARNSQQRNLHRHPRADGGPNSRDFLFQCFLWSVCVHETRPGAPANFTSPTIRTLGSGRWAPNHSSTPCRSLNLSGLCILSLLTQDSLWYLLYYSYVGEACRGGDIMDMFYRVSHH